MRTNRNTVERFDRPFALECVSDGHPARRWPVAFAMLILIVAVALLTSCAQLPDSAFAVAATSETQPTWREWCAVGFLSAMLILVFAAVRKLKENEVWLEELRGKRISQMEDPFACVTDGLTCEEMHRILVSVAAEAREVRRLTETAMLVMSDDDCEDALEIAKRRVTCLIHCVEALCERLVPVVSDDGSQFSVRGSQFVTREGGRVA